MGIKAPSLGIDPLVALVGGGGLFVSGVATLLPWRPVTGQAISFVGVAAFVIALVVLALGLPGRHGAVGRSVVVRAALVAAAVVTVFGRLGGGFVPVDEASLASAGHQVFVVVLSAAGLAAPLLLLVGAATVGRSPGATHDSRLGLRALAIVSLVAYVVPEGTTYLAVAVGPSQESLIALFEFSSIVARLCAVFTLAVGVWFAWPWLEPRLLVARAALHRLWRRYVDSTP